MTERGRRVPIRGDESLEAFTDFTIIIIQLQFLMTDDCYKRQLL